MNAAESDAAAMERLCRDRGFETTILKTAQATRANVLRHLDDFAGSLVAGDTLVVTYAGHGSQLPDENGNEDDARDETWCLYDGQLLDDELYACWADFASGVRIAVISDSCHSGSVAWLLPEAESEKLEHGSRLMPPDVQVRTFEENRAFYDRLLQAPPSTEPTCSLVLIAACKDDQLSREKTFHGIFTKRLLKVWNNGAFRGSYQAFTDAILAGVPKTQLPQCSFVGAPNPSFYQGQVFEF